MFSHRNAFAAICWCTAITGCAGGCSRDSFLASFNELRGDSYALDDYDRSVGDAGVVCPEAELVRYSGAVLSFSPYARVHPAFAKRLRRFEGVVDSVARRYYARAPHRVVNAGSYVCRTVAHRPYRLSEHALGNAIDIVGFDFQALPTDAPVSTDTASEAREGSLELSAELKAPLRVRVQHHWDAPSEGHERVHSAFLHALTEQLQEDDVFRTMLGPSDPAHATHLHLGMTPWKHINL